MPPCSSGEHQYLPCCLADPEGSLAASEGHQTLLSPMERCRHSHQYLEHPLSAMRWHLSMKTMCNHKKYIPAEKRRGKINETAVANSGFTTLVWGKTIFIGLLDEVYPSEISLAYTSCTWKVLAATLLQHLARPPIHEILYK
jgi:hypothetical protein